MLLYLFTRITTGDVVLQILSWDFWQVQTVSKELCSEMVSVPVM